MQLIDYDKLILGERIFGLEIIDSTVKVLELKKSGGKFVVVGLGQEVLDPKVFSGDVIVKPEEVAAAIKKARNNARPHKSRSRYASVYLPDSKIFVRVVKFPAKMGKEEIREAVQWKAKDLLALPLEKVYWDWHRLSPQEGAKEVDVVISSVEKETADSYTKTLRLLNIIPIYYDISGNAAARFLFQKDYKKKKALLIRIDHRTTTLKLFLDGGVRYQTILTDLSKAGYVTLVDQATSILKLERGEVEKLILHPKNLNNDQKALLQAPFEAFFAGLLKEVNQILDYYNQTLSPNKGVSKSPMGDLDGIFLYGRGAKVFHIEEYFKANTLPLSTKISSSSSLSPIVQFVSRQSILENLSILGLSLRNLGLFRDLRDINLVPAKIKRRYLQRSVYSSLYANLRIIFWSSLVITIGIAVAYVMTLVYKMNVDRELASVQNLAESSANKKLQDEINYVNSTASQIDVLLDTQLDWSLFFREISVRRGNGILFNNILVTDDESAWKALSNEKRVIQRDGYVYLIISGTATDRDVLQLYSTSMEDSELFEDVRMPISNFEERLNIDFTLYCLLNTALLHEDAQTQ